MADIHSLVVGSFLRNAGFPLEADYTFESEQELIEFYSDEDNQKLLYQGWLKVVGEGDNQALYWVVKEGEELKFKKLLENVDRDKVKGWLEEIQKKLQEGEIAINSLDQAVKELQESSLDLILKTNAIIGSGEDWKSYLDTLDYPSITALSEAVSKFFKEIDELDDKINTLPELQDFLEGYKDTDKLKDILQNLYNSIVGNVEPGTTIESLRRHLLDLIQALSNKCYNLQTELDQTQQGVGLSGDGAYNADSETYYLQSATSVMNALKILDRVLHRSVGFTVESTDSIEFDDNTDEDTYDRTISANVKVAEDSDIIIESDGLYHKVELDFDKGNVILNVNGEERSRINIGLESLLQEAYYDKTTEQIVLIFNLHNGEVLRMEIAATDLITEWQTTNTDAISLNRTRVVNGTDELSADLNISEDSKNGIEVKEDGVFMSKDAADLTYKGESLEETIETIELNQEEDLAKITELQGKLNGHDLDELEGRVDTIEDVLFDKEVGAVGDVVLVDNETLEKIAVKPDKLKLYKDTHTPIGVVVIPQSHDVYGTGEGAMLSLKYMRYNNPNEGGEAQGMYWGPNSRVSTNLYGSYGNFPKVNSYLEESPTVAACSSNPYFPSDKFQSNISGQDPLVGYKSTSDPVPSPYLKDDKRNPLYYGKDVITDNCLSHFDGKDISNAAWTKLDSSKIGWRELPTLTDTYLDYPAFATCWRYFTEGTEQGDWYLPSAGEIGYMMARFNAINTAILEVQAVWGFGAVLLSYYHWSASEYNSNSAWYLGTTNSALYYSVTNKYYVSYHVRAFCRVKLSEPPRPKNLLDDHIQEANQKFEELESKLDLSEYIKTSEVDSKLEEYATEEYVDSKFVEVDNTNGYEYVDMGEAGIWAKYPIGVSDWNTWKGDVLYFEWGGIQGYTAQQVRNGEKPFNSDFTDYRFSGEGAVGYSNPQLTKYCNDAQYGKDKTFSDELTILEPEDDAAHVHMGGNWRMPVTEEFQKLLDLCNSTWVTNYNDISGLHGRLFTLKSDSSKQLFIPAAGLCYFSLVWSVGSGGCFWSSSLDESKPSNGFTTGFSSDNVNLQQSSNRYAGRCVVGFISPTEKYLTKKEAKETYQEKGDYVTNDSVDNKLSQLKSEILGEDLSEDFDTLKEVHEWIEDHEDVASGLIGDINSLKETIAQLQSEIAELKANKADKSILVNDDNISIIYGTEYEED